MCVMQVLYCTFRQLFHQKRPETAISPNCVILHTDSSLREGECGRERWCLGERGGFDVLRLLLILRAVPAKLL